MKKRFSVFYIFVALTFLMSTVLLFNKNKMVRKAYAENVTQIQVESKETILLDANSKTIIHKNNELEKKPIASMCKIMTLLLCFENIDDNNLSLDEEIVISNNASGMGGSQIFLEENGRYKVSDLIKGIVVASANDACVALAERLYGSEDAFVEKMNQKASELGMTSTHFTNATGLPKEGQYSCALDVATMFIELISHKEYFDFSNIWMDKINHPNNRVTEISNTNKLIRFYQGCDSGKTGYTSQAGHCLAASAIKNNMRLVCVVINAPDSKTRFREASNLFNYGFNNYENKLLLDNKQILSEQVPVSNGKKDKIECIIEDPIYIFCKKNEKRSVEIVVKPDKNINAPIYKHDVIGEIEIYENGVLINSVKIFSNEDILEKDYADYINDVIKNWAI